MPARASPGASIPTCAAICPRARAATWSSKSARSCVGRPCAPIQAKSKVSILDRVDMLGTAAANAFLKTLEEPPANVPTVLLGRMRESVLPTIVSRCQVVPFRHIPATEAAGIIRQNTGALTRPRASLSRHVWFGITRACEF